MIFLLLFYLYYLTRISSPLDVFCFVSWLHIVMSLFKTMEIMLKKNAKIQVQHFEAI